MNQIIIGVGAIVVLILGYYMFQGSTVSYVATVTDDVDQLEAELAEIDAAVQAGTMTPEAAAKAQAKIYARIDSINDAISSSQSLKLTPAQRVELIAGLNRMKDVLGRYRATLTAVDEAVLTLPENKRPKSKGGGSRKGIVASITEAIDVVEEHIDDVSEDVSEDEEVAEDGTDTTDESADEEDDSINEDEIVDDSTETEDDETETESDIEVDASLEATMTDEETDEATTTN